MQKVSSTFSHASTKPRPDRFSAETIIRECRFASVPTYNAHISNCPCRVCEEKRNEP